MQHRLVILLNEVVAGIYQEDNQKVQLEAIKTVSSNCTVDDALNFRNRQ
jgi:hypothetical protein